MTDECRVELKVRKGQRSSTKGLRINGHEIPGVTDVYALWRQGDARRISIDLLPTDVIEVDEAEW